MMRVVQRASGDPALAILPLTSEVSKALATELIRDDRAAHCGNCEKPFTVVRKWRGIARVTHFAVGRGLLTAAWLLCGRCQAEMKRNGNRVADKLIAEAREAVSAWQLHGVPPGGTS